MIAQVRAICLALPEAEEKPFGGHTAPSFRVRDKLFVMTSEDGTSMTMKAPPGVQAVLVGSDPARATSCPNTWVPRGGSACAWTWNRRPIGTRRPR
jgi:hypothetical protein